ncbi:putative mediator of RNA polymerase II transcription subunit 29 isoform X2 [Copidosoma floridanum]|uniref:putative mediator of RNA polymerase II transcription subunit 29 isoform X2 n=1 Tax=Copidosoma floridanum TaxID=29053 RepID=UPI0006C9556D|nr:putative mediator of RNA polymerase II transcription subunit 29 isoform X2 [Copidosoma floridanum]
MVVLPKNGIRELEYEVQEDGVYHRIMFGNSDLLEEIVETTEEQESDLCGGETVEECSGLPIGEFAEEIEQKPSIIGLVVNNFQVTAEPAASNGASLGSSASAMTTTTGKQHKSSRSSSNNSNHHNHHSNNGNGNTSDPIGGTAAAASSAEAGTTSSSSTGPTAPNHIEQEKRMRREIANSNERRRMQSINAGFQSLRHLLPLNEGEKLSKAAILQQTAEYIYQLEQQKTQLLSQNLQLKRLVDQHEGGEAPPNKKRKNDSQGVVMSLPMHVSESGDEGLGSMSPEPLSVITVSAEGHAAITAAANEVAELKRQLEHERASRAHLEKQLRSMQSQLFPERFREEQLIAYQPHEVIEHTNNVLAQELEDGLPSLQVVSVVSVPTVGSTQTIETSNADSNTPPLSPQPGCEVILPNNPDEIDDDENDEDDENNVVVQGDNNVGIVVSKDCVSELLAIESSRPNSPKVLQAFPVFATQLEQADAATYAAAASLPVGQPTTAAVAAQFITASPTRPFSPDQQDPASQQPSLPQQRLPSVLEAAMKAEPKVEVERLPSPSNSLDDGTAQGTRLYLANTSRQNLETIVEAIRHLEGDHLFSDEPAQDAPLALTNKPSAVGGQRVLHADVNSFLQYHVQQSGAVSPVQSAPVTTASQQQSRTPQQRPGVIVVKHS